MTPDPDRLYHLLPAVYRQRDFEIDEPLRALLAVISEQVNAVDQDIAQLYDNWFIETCQDWAVPYIGDLIGYQPRTPASLPDQLSSPGERTLESMLIPRREVANTLSFRQRKGTLAVLEQMARDLTGWPARAEELDHRFAITQALNHLRPERGRWIDLRARRVLDRLGGPFDSAGRTVRLGRTDVLAGGPSDVLPAVGVFIWRLKVYALDHVPAYCVQQAGEHCFTFSAFGNNVPLFARGSADGPTAGKTGLAAFPGAIRRGEFAQVVPHRHRVRLRASSDYYGVGKSVAVWAPNWCGADGKLPVPVERVIPADLSRWSFEPPRGHIAVDPELGRLAFAPGEMSKDGVWVSYCYGFGDDLGGGPYARRLPYPPVPPGMPVTPVYFVGSGAQYASIGAALKAWKTEAPASAIIEVVDSEVYAEQLRIKLGTGQSLEIRAANGARPVIDIIGANSNRSEALTVSGESASAFRLDGIVIFGRAVEVKGYVARFSVCDCTLVPGWGRENDPMHERSNEPSLVFVNTAARISISRSILGALRVIRTEPDLAPAPCLIERSIIDATGPEAAAFGGEEGRVAGIVLTIKRSTVLGQTRVHAIALAENSIFTGVVRVARRQQGCMRFCYLPFDSRTPSRYQCQPNAEEREISESFSGERRRVKPEFVSTRYGAPGYCQLADTCPREIKRGAEDRSELGVFHDLFEPQRLDMLVAAAADFAPVGTQSRVIFVD
jgi:hypothetical protein